MNQLLADLPVGTQRPPVFLANKWEVQSGMTGKIRRKTLSFQRVVLMGMHPLKCPDDDEDVQAALLLDYVYGIMRGLNQPSSRQMRNVEDISDLQEHCYEIGRK